MGINEDTVAKQVVEAMGTMFELLGQDIKALIKEDVDHETLGRKMKEVLLTTGDALDTLCNQLIELGYEDWGAE